MGVSCLTEKEVPQGGFGHLLIARTGWEGAASGGSFLRMGRLQVLARAGEKAVFQAKPFPRRLS